MQEEIGPKPTRIYADGLFCYESGRNVWNFGREGKGERLGVEKIVGEVRGGGRCDYFEGSNSIEIEL